MASMHGHEGAEQSELHVVAHTHWDREWYQPFPRFQQRLVALVDALLEQVDSARPFLLDGQAILIRDYLAGRPEQRPRLGALLRMGALEAGPWYVLADNLIPCGEAIVRNLQAGRRLLATFDVTPPPVAYCPDSFGHPAALPLIANGFGFDVAVVWRGYGGPAHPRGDAARWSCVDGSSLVLWHFPRDGYEFGSALPTDLDAAEERWQRIHDELLSRAQNGVTMLPCGADHHALQQDLDLATDRLRLAATAAGHQVSVTRSTLAQFAKALSLRARELPHVVQGELRNSYGYTWTLSGTLGTRAADKRRNAQLERLLLHDVEPWCALALLATSTHGEHHDGRVGRPHVRALLAHAWETLLETHPHDTLCGCSVDAVARDMRTRQRSVHAQAVGLRQDAMALVLGHDVAAARTRAIERRDGFPLVLRNRSGRTRSGVASLRLQQTIGDVAVGPGSAHMSQPVVPDTVEPPDFPGAQHRASRIRYAKRESPQHYPDQDLVAEHDMLVWTHGVPAHGLRIVHDVAELHADSAPSAVLVAESSGEITVENERLRVRATSAHCELGADARLLSPLLRLGITQDAGDSYTPAPRGETVWLEQVSVELRHRGPLRGSIRIRWQLPGLYAKRLWVVTDLELDAGASALRIVVHGSNRLSNHRLRLHVGTDVPGAVVYADAAFGPVLREPIVVSEAEALMEAPVPTMPLHRWVTASNTSRAVTVISDGLAEAEVQGNDVAITLVRAIGELSRGDLPERPGNAGWPAYIPNAQSQGPFHACVGMLLHDGWSRTDLDVVERAADDLLLPLVGVSWRDLVAPSQQLGGIEIEGSGLRCQAVMPDQDGQGIVVRIVNQWTEPGGGVLRLPFDNLQVARCRLDETLLEDWQPVGRTMSVSVDARAALSLRIRRAP